MTCAGEIVAEDEEALKKDEGPDVEIVVKMLSLHTK